MANYGGGIYIVSCSPTVNKNWIEANDGIIGGGIGIHAYNTTDSALPVISDNYLYENWPRDNKPPNDEPNNTYDGNTHSSGDGADVFFEND